MKVVFMEDVPNVGKAGQIKEVADGYGKNYLLPRKLACPPDLRILRHVEAQIKARARIEAKTEAEMKALAGELEGKEIILKAKVGQQDRLYGSITSADIAIGLESSLHAVVDKRKIELTEPIRQFGSSEVSIKLGKDIATKIKVTIVAEEAVNSYFLACQEQTIVYNDKLPPHDISAEEAVIGSLLIDGAAIYEIATLLQKADFYHEPHQWLYEACLTLYQRNESINQITVAQELDRLGKLEQCGRRCLFSHLISVVPTPLDILDYAQIVYRLSISRHLITAGQQISNIGFQAEAEPRSSISKAEDILLKLSSDQRNA